MEFCGLLQERLVELKSVELQLMKALPKLSLAAACDQLETLLALHLKETEGQVDRLAKIAQGRGQEIPDEPHPVMAAMIEAALQIAGQGAASLRRDVALVGACQKIEHYEMAAYESAALLAKRSGEATAAVILEQTLKEEVAADHLLGTVAAEIEAGSIRRQGE